MEYLNIVLGVRVVYSDIVLNCYANFIESKYRIRKVTLDGVNALFVYPRNELDNVSLIKKHIEKIRSENDYPIVFVLEKMSSRLRDSFIKEHIPFIVDGRQIYLPFMAVYLQEKFDREKNIVDEPLLPSAQVLLLYFIYQGCGELLTSVAANKLGFTPTSISRASTQLVEKGIINIKKLGVQKIIYSEKNPRDLFYCSIDYLINPIKRTVYVNKTDVQKNLLTSGYSALSEYSSINQSELEYFASFNIGILEKKSSIKLIDSESQCAVEFWRYDPRILTTENTFVDRLSLALSLRHDKDERVESAIEEMLEQVWIDIDAKRNR